MVMKQYTSTPMKTKKIPALARPLAVILGCGTLFAQAPLAPPGPFGQPNPPNPPGQQGQQPQTAQRPEPPRLPPNRMPQAPARPDFGDPLPGLTQAELASFADGLIEFQNVETPQTGLGPIFNNVSCVACHSA